jgi:ankyrin repeat protein
LSVRRLSLHQDGFTALAYASAEGRPGVAKVLLERGAGTLEHITKVSIKGFTPLSMAIAAGHEKIAVMLVQRLVLCTGFGISQPLPGLRKGLPLLAAAANNGMCELAELALDSGALVDATGEYGSAARQASSKGHLQVLSLLRRRGADLGGCLATAAAAGHVQTIKKLLKLGVDVNSLSAGQTMPAVCVAAARAQLAAVEALLAAGAAIPLNQQNSVLRSLCHKLDDAVAAQMLQLLLPRCDMYEAVPRNDGDPTAFAQAVCGGKLQAAKLLASAGADVMYVDVQRRNAVHLAAGSSSLAALQWVVSLRVDPRARARHGSVPLHCASARVPAQADIMEYLLGLPGAAADLTAVDIDGRTPLHIAADKGSDAAVQALLQRGANVAAADHKGATPLMLAKTAAVVKLLLAAGADAAAADIVGCTALHYCARSNAAAGAVCVLLKAGTDPTATALNHATAADVAAYKGHTALQTLLLRAADDYSKAHPQAVRASAVKHSEVGDSASGAAAATGSSSAVPPAATAAAAVTTHESSSSNRALGSLNSSSSSELAAAAGSSDSTNTAVAAAQPSAVSTGCASSIDTSSVQKQQQQQQQQKPAAQKAKQPCANCGNTEHTRRCRACAAVYYCSIECQKVCFADARHRAECEAKAALLT